jgi:hypothetical protein
MAAVFPPVLPAPVDFNALINNAFAQLQEGQARLEVGQARVEAGQARLEAGHARLEAGIQNLLNELQGRPRPTYTTSAQIAKVANRVLQANQRIVPLPLVPTDPQNPCRFVAEPPSWPVGGIQQENFSALNNQLVNTLSDEYNLPRERNADTKRRRLGEHLNVHHPE